MKFCNCALPSITQSNECCKNCANNSCLTGDGVNIESVFDMQDKLTKQLKVEYPQMYYDYMTGRIFLNDE